jgi:hypothetical protein
MDTEADQRAYENTVKTMKRIMVSAYDRPFFDYGIRMYRSFARFNPHVPRYFVRFVIRGKEPLDESQVAAIRDLGVKVLTVEGNWPCTPHFWDMLLWPALKDIDWDAMMWVDADAMILRPVDPVWWPRVDFVAIPDRDNDGLRTICDIRNGRIIPGDGPYAMFASGTWVTRSRKLLQHFYDYIDADPPTRTENDQAEMTKIVNLGDYTYEQLNGYLWCFARQMIPLAKYSGNQITYSEHGRTWRPYKAAFSRVPIDGREHRLTSPALEQFYAEQVIGYKPKPATRRIAQPPSLKYVPFDVTAELASGRIFSYAKYGDGERRWLLDDDITNCDGHAAHRDAAEALRQSLTQWRRRKQNGFMPEAYIVPGRGYPDGSQHELADWDERFLEWIKQHGLGKLTWSQWNMPMTQLIRDATIGVEFSLVTALKQLPVVLVGPEYLMRPVEYVNAPYTVGLTNSTKQRPTRPLSSVFPVRHFIPVAAKDCWLDHERVRGELERIHRDDTARPLCVLLSCSLLSKVLIGELYDTIGQDCWMIDTGSLWDPFVGITTREYQLPITPRLNYLMKGMSEYGA